MSLLLISGSLRDGSTNTALLRTAHAIDADTELFAGMGALPHFSPDDDGDDLPAAVRDLRAATGRAEALLVCTPEYAGALPGAFKNLLEWLGRGRGGLPQADRLDQRLGPGRAHRRPPTRTRRCARSSAYLSMEIVEEACVRIPVARDAIGEDGLIADPAIREPLAAALAALREGAARVESF